LGRQQTLYCSAKCCYQPSWDSATAETQCRDSSSSARKFRARNCRRRIYASELNASPGRWLCLFRASMCSDFDELTCLRGAVLRYSLWPGYLRKDERLRNWVRRHGIDLQVKHTSGHAYTPDLIRLAESIAPRRLVPIHSSHPEQYGSLFRNVILVPDGVWFDV